MTVLYPHLTCLCQPIDWKRAKISPLFKKGDVKSTECYRLLAVNSVLYRLHTGVIKELLTEWCKEVGAIPDSQFGFYPGRSAHQAMFVLRHLINKTHWNHVSGIGRVPKLFSAFMDFSSAFDTVPRAALWEKLEEKGCPAYLIDAIKSLYQR